MQPMLQLFQRTMIFVKFGNLLRSTFQALFETDA